MLGACTSASGNSDDSKTTVTNETTELTTVEETTTEETTAAETTLAGAEIDATKELNPLMGGTKKVAEQDIYFDYPDVPYVYIEKGYTSVYLIDQQRIIAISIERDSGSYEGVVCSTPEEAFDYYTSSTTVGRPLLKAIENYCALKEVKEYQLEKLEINGITVNRYEGIAIVRSSRYEAYMYAYTFVWNDHPVMIYGCVYDKNGQTQEQKDEVKTIVDLMMESFRDTL